MDFNSYQKKARDTAIYPSGWDGLVYCTLALSGEGGEAANKLKKVIRDDGGVLTEEKREALREEVGDVLWYCANLAHELGYDLDFCAQKNLEKLAARKEAGTIGGSGDYR